MNVTSILTKDYENVPLRRCGKTNPIQTQSNPISNSERNRLFTFSLLLFLLKLTNALSLVSFADFA